MSKNKAFLLEIQYPKPLQWQLWDMWNVMLPPEQWAFGGTESDSRKPPCAKAEGLVRHWRAAEEEGVLAACAQGPAHLRSTEWRWHGRLPEEVTTCYMEALWHLFKVQMGCSSFVWRVQGEASQSSHVGTVCSSLYEKSSLQIPLLIPMRWESKWEHGLEYKDGEIIRQLNEEYS